MNTRPVDDDDDEPEYSTTVAGTVVSADGAMINLVVFYDGENFFSRLSPLEDIVNATAQSPIPTLYSYKGWLTGLIRTPQGGLVVGDADGQVHIQTDDGWDIEATGDEAIRAVCAAADGTLFVAGTDGHVRQRTEEGWVALGESFGLWLNALATGPSGEVLVAGDAGLAALWDGAIWTRIDLATNATLNAAHRDSSGRWMLCGARGTLFREDDGAWEDFTADLPNLFGFDEFGGQTWIACGTAGPGVVGEDGAVEIMRDTFAARQISSAGDFIAFGGNDLAVRFDGKDWAAWRYA